MVGSIRPKDKTIVQSDGRLILEWDAFFSRLEQRIIDIESDVEAIEGEINAPFSAGTSGYVHLYGDLILQWGVDSTGDTGIRTVTFPIAFPTAPLAIIGHCARGGATQNRSLILRTDQANSFTATQMLVQLCSVVDGTGSSTAFYWAVIGH